MGKPISRGIYNLGTGQARAFLDLVRPVFSTLKKQETIEFIDTPLVIRDRYQYFTEANMTKFFSVASEFEFTSLEDGVTEYVQDYLMQENPHC